MMEKKLRTAAQVLPVPESGFDTVLIPEHKTTSVRPAHRISPALIALCMILFLTISAGAYRYGQIQRETQVVRRYSNLVMPVENAWGKTQKLLKKLDVVLPETLMGTPFEEGTQMSVVPRDTSRLEAMFTEFFTPVCLYYSNVVFTDAYGNYDRLRYLSVDVGSTQQPYWKYFFNVDDNGDFYPDATHVLQYKGIELRGYSRTVVDEWNNETFVIHSVQWVDEKKTLCFNISVARTDSVEFLIDCAKQIIDLNH